VKDIVNLLNALNAKLGNEETETAASLLDTKLDTLTAKLDAKLGLEKMELSTCQRSSAR
jgi:hypothetical protein